MSPRRRIIPIFVPHLGCPNDCVFCNQKRISGSRFPVSADEVRVILDSLPVGGGYEAAFYGGSFTAIEPIEQEKLLGALASYRKAGTITSVRLSTRPDAIDAATLERLGQFGVGTVELGAQSMCERVLRESGRGHTAEDTRRAANMLREAGFKMVLQMMTGLPGSDDEKELYTARELIDLKPNGVRIYPAVIVRDTALETLWRAGLYKEHTVEDAVRICAQILPLFEEADIPIIRLGLNPTEDLSGGDAVAGAYHPALGELVRSRVLRQRAQTLLTSVPKESKVVLGVSPERLSAMIGQHRENILWLERHFSLSQLRISACCEAGEGILLLHIEKS